MSQNTILTDVQFHFFSLKFKPLANVRDSYNSGGICKAVILHLTNIKKQGEAILCDRNEKRTKKSSREVFISSASFDYNERRAKLTMALIRKGKRPKIMQKGTFKLKSIKDLGDIVEVTHFFIDISGDNNVICTERNPNGPNIHDITYYLQKVAKVDLNLARTTELIVPSTGTIENSMDKIKNVLKFDVKIRPSNLDFIESKFKNNYFSGFEILSKIYSPEAFRIEAFFKKNGRKLVKRKENKIATSMFKEALSIFNKDPEQTEFYENFDVVYEDAKGIEDTFSLLKDKYIITYKIEAEKDLSLKESYDFIKNDITDFVKRNED